MQISLKAPTPVTFDSKLLHLNLNGLTYYNGFSPLLNWWKTAAPVRVGTSGGEVSDRATLFSTYLNTNGDLPVPCSASVTYLASYAFAFPEVESTMAGEGFTVKWDGRGCTFAVNLLTTGGTSSVDNANGSATFTLGTTPGNVELKWTITDRTDPPRNIRVYQTRYATNVANGETFNPDWLTQVRKFKTLRFMDWMGTNGSPVTDYAHFAVSADSRWNGVYNSDYNKHGFPVSVIAALANATGCDVHVCIPHQATDACVTALAAALRDAITGPSVVAYEYSNECWNSGFTQQAYCNTQGAALFASGNSFNDGRKWYGYRAAQCMKLIRDAYNNRARWRGVVGAWTVNSSVTQTIIDGVTYWKTSTGSALNVADLFNEIAITGYFGGVQSSIGISAITRANPGVVTSVSAHGLTTGQKVRFAFHPSDGMTQLDGVEATVTVLTLTTFSIGINTTAYTALVASPLNAYCHEAKLFQLMDQSEASHAADATTYPTNYTYFAQQMASAMQTGYSTSGLVADPGTTVAELQNTYWPGHKTIATANGLTLRQYEGGCHFLGGNYLQGYGGSNSLGDRLVAYMLNTQHSAAFAAVYSASYTAFKAAGGVYPSKFTEAGPTGRYGGWGGMRYLPCAAAPSGDASNPVWQAVLAGNGFSIS